MYQEIHIEYWGEIFVSARIIEFGITFDALSQRPKEAFDPLWSRICTRRIAEGLFH